MIKFFKDHTREFIFTAVILLCVFLIVAAVVLLDAYSKDLDEQAKARVEGYAADATYRLTERVNMLNQRTKHISERLAACENADEVRAILSEVSGLAEYEGVMTVRFFDKDGVEYDEHSAPIREEHQESDKVLAASKTEGTYLVGTVNDRELREQAVAFYSSVKDGAFVKSLVMFYPVSEISDAFDSADEEKLKYADAIAFCSADGYVLRLLHSKEEFNDRNLFDYLRKRINDKQTVDGIERDMQRGESRVLALPIAGESYVISVSGGGESGGGLCIVGLYRSSATYSEGYKIVNSILSTMIIIFIILICLLLYFMINGSITRKRIYEIGSLNKDLGCLTSLGFQQKAEEILSKNSGTRFAVIMGEVRFFNYITEHYGSQESQKLLKYINVIYKKAMLVDEAYGYHADGQFFLLLHYKEIPKLMERLNKFVSFVRKYPTLAADNYTAKLHFGIYEVDRSDEQTVQHMMDKAIVAKNTTSPLGTEQPLKFYDSSLRESYIQTADIESRAEGALANEEFAVFYQPKLNVAENCIEGAEALVRWYDPEKNIYRSPAAFLPIFESNGFIVKVDHFVYEKVCKYISESIERHQAVYPVSVNISRLTAIQPDFKEKYISLKDRYHVPDKMLILEFTESFAYENYSDINETINHMHRNGFIFSIDDFGSGYSSYNILKSVNMDEIKMDAMFIRKGLDDSRDKIILESVITTAKQMGMKVTQEGVETADDLEVLRKLGCDVVQGYYYSKPLALTDYITFLNEHVKR